MKCRRPFAGLVMALAAALAVTASVPHAARADTPAARDAQAAVPGGAPAPNLAAPSPEYAEDIREIRGAKYVLPAWILGAALAAAAVLAALGYGIWRWLRRTRPTRALLPFEVALRDLESIRPLMQPGTVREFSIQVSDIVRRYIEERFHVTAAHRTTEEFLHDLLTSSEATLAKHRGLLSEFLELCDLAKFAGMSLSEANMESLYQSARGFVIETARSVDAAGPATGPTARPAATKEAHDSVPSA